ncbi:MAG: ABC transporter ATP-binding protein [Chitinophagaceae bacterium]
MDKSLLVVENLSVDFISNQQITNALSNINFSVNSGEIVAIVGESGSGKSVTSLSILQLLPTPPAKFSSGSIWLHTNHDSLNLLACSEEQMRCIRGKKIAMIFQEPMSSLNPVIRCGDQIMEAIILHSKVDTATAKQKTIALLNQVQLPDPELTFQKYPHQLSGGQKQRVMIAMAMSCEPNLLICDEPTTALDVTVQKSILQLIKALQIKNNMGVIFITHDLGVVAEIADKVVVLYKGKMIETNTTNNIFKQPTHPYTKALLACRPILYSKQQRLPIVSDFMSDTEKLFTKVITSNNEPLKPTNKSVLLSIQNLKVYYTATKTFLGKPITFQKAIDDVSFDVYDGETIGLVGESGCGKSTLGRTIVGLTKATSGIIMYKGKNILDQSKDAWLLLRREMQIIFQDPYAALNPRITIGKAIEEPMEVHNLITNKKERKNKVIELLEKVGLAKEHYDRFPHEFSGGQRQRIVIARALAVSPKFIICDESVSALDVSVQAQILNLLNDLKQEFKFTNIFISHDLSVVKYLCDRIVVMQKGKIEEIGVAEDIYYHPTSHYTKQLIQAIPTGKIN